MAVFYGIKFIGLLIALAVTFPAAAFSSRGMTRSTYIFTACAGGLGFYLPDFVVGKCKKRRGEVDLPGPCPMPST